MNDMEERNQKVWGGKWKGPPDDQEFKEIRYCDECGFILLKPNETKQCPNCKTKKPSTALIFQCSLCLEEHETEECNCYQS